MWLSSVPMCDLVNSKLLLFIKLNYCICAPTLNISIELDCKKKIKGKHYNTKYTEAHAQKCEVV